MDLYLKLFGRAKCYKWNLFLLKLAYKGLGIEQWQNVRVSGEQYFLRSILPRKKNMVVFDVGARLGSYSKQVLRFHPDATVYAFEPHPKSFEHLKRTAQQSKFHPFQLAMGAMPASKHILYDYSHKNGSAQASLYEEAFKQYGYSTLQHEVSMTTVDSFAKEHHIEHIDLLKIDVEGFEYEVLKGACRMIGSLSVDIIQFEINNLSLISKRTIFDFMEMLTEFSFYRLLYRGMIPLDQRLHALSEHQNIIAFNNHCKLFI